MRVLKNVNMDEFQKCGDIVVAAKKNKLAMSCNFCQQMFEQLQAFTRHLQKQHNDTLEFVKQAKEIEVYTVEELINQNVALCEELDQDESKWLGEDEMKWLDEGVEPMINPNSNLECIEEEGLSIANMSILKALEDCDVSFNLMDNLYSSNCYEQQSNTENTLLQEIYNDWEDSDTNGSIPTSTAGTDTELSNFSKHLINISEEVQEDLNITDLPLNDMYTEEFQNTITETSQSNSIKSLLQGVEDLDDVDILLENLENNLITSEIKKSDAIETYGCKVLKKEFKNQNLQMENHSNNNKVLLNSKIAQKSKTNESNIFAQAKILQNIGVDTETKKAKEFETRLKELEEAIDEDISNSNYIDIQKPHIEQVPTKIILNCYAQNDFDLKLKELENALKDDNIDGHNNYFINSNMISYPKLQQQNFKESLDETAKKIQSTTELLEENSNTLHDTSLNEDLTKALADALDGDLDLLNTQLEEESEDHLNEEILNLLERELTEKEIEPPIPIHKERFTFDTKTNLKENIATNTLNEQRSVNINKTGAVTKYQKTNLKAKTKILETQDRSLLKPIISSILKDSNAINDSHIAKNRQKLLKANYEISLPQQQLNSLKSPAKSSAVENNNKKISKNLQRETPCIEKNTPTFNIQKIKYEKTTPVSSFMISDRRHKMPNKNEQIFLNRSPKTQEKQETSNNKTPIRCAKTAQEVNIKCSPRTQEKHENEIPQYTPLPATRHKTPQLKKENLKKSPTAAEEPTIEQKNNKTPEKPRNDKFVSKESKCNSTLKFVTRSNEKSESPTKTVINSYAKTPLTTPQRLRNVTIKLHRFTPEKITHLLQKQEKLSIKDGAKNIGKHFKLPKGTSFTLLPKPSSCVEDNQCKIIETPTKDTYWKQNFSECSLENSQYKKTPKDNFTVAKSSPMESNRQIINKLQETEANLLKQRQRKASIDIVPSTQGNNKQTIKMSASKTPRNSNLDYKSYAINRSFRKKEVLQRMHNIKKQIFKSIEGSECVENVINTKSTIMKPQKKENVYISKLTILPNLEKDVLEPLILHNSKKASDIESAKATKISSAPPKNCTGNQKHSEISLQGAENESSNNNNENLIKKTLKRKASSPLLNENEQAKRGKKSSAKRENEDVEKIPDLEETQFNLSESVVNFLQRDLKTNPVSVESLLNEALAENDCSPNDTSFIMNDLIQQVHNEQTTKAKINENLKQKDAALSNHDLFEDFNESKDINLLSKFGLKIIKCPEIEDVITLEERDQMNEKAIKFANIYKKWPRLWTTKTSESHTFKEELEKSFEQLLNETNASFNLDLRIAEVKRLVNLINLWYTNSFSSKLIQKRIISDSINRYLLMFHFIPKTVKRFYFCEYCAEYFNTEHKYFTHRIIHTGALYPYTCHKCSIGFRIMRQLTIHESSCKLIPKKEKCATKSPPNTCVKSSPRYNKCLVCGAIFKTSELLYQHSKTHLKTIYKCIKCELVFASAMDVQNHMRVCNTVTKRMPKQYTPRPPKAK